MGIRTVEVLHLGGIHAAYQMPYDYDPKKPTLVLVNSFMTTSELYNAQFEDQTLTSATNLIAIEPLGHGETRTKSENFTYWDSAIMITQAMSALGIDKYFLLGTSQGGWIVARVALLAPSKVLGIVPVGTSMDYESERSIKLGCWTLRPIGIPLIEKWTTKTVTPNFEPDDGYCDFLIDIGLGKDCDKKVQEFWTESVKRKYAGDEGRKRARMAAINLLHRDGLYGRLFDISCPVLWLHGTEDAVYTVANAKEEVGLFRNSPDARLSVVEGGQHFLSASHPQEVNAAVVDFIKTHS